MRDLSNLAANAMWVTSQEAGNLVHDNSPAMTAPGSQPATPLPAVEDYADPHVDLGAQRPVGTAPERHASDHSFSPAPDTWKVITDG